MTPAKLLIYKGRHKKNTFNIIYIMRTYAKRMEDRGRTGDAEANANSLHLERACIAGGMKLYY